MIDLTKIYDIISIMKSKRKNIPGSISIADIARECGVSVMTVSRALRQNPQVKPETSDAIMNMAAKLGYMRSSRLGRPSARRNGKISKVQLIIGSTGQTPVAFHARLLTSIEQQLAESGCECIIRSANGDYQVFMRLLEAARHTDAQTTLIFGNFPPEQLHALLSALPGSILLDNPGCNISDGTYSSFAFDNTAAAHLAVEHLLACGRQKILLIGGFADHFFTREIETGFIEAMNSHHIQFSRNQIINTDFTASGAASALENVIAEKSFEFDAIFTNDEMAVGVYRVLMERGLKIPDDVAVCGCDNLPISEQLFPPLTTIKLNYDDLASQVLQYIRAPGKTFVPLRTRLSPSLLIRSSTIASA